MVFSLRDAATLMIIESDNTATDYCYEAIGGPDAVNATMRELGFSDIEALGNCIDWFSALAGVIDPALGELGPAELFRAGYPDLAPEDWISARDRFHFQEGRPFSHASARALGQLAGDDLERPLRQPGFLRRNARLSCTIRYRVRACRSTCPKRKSRIRPATLVPLSPTMSVSSNRATWRQSSSV